MRHLAECRACRGAIHIADPREQQRPGERRGYVVAQETRGRDSYRTAQDRQGQADPVREPHQEHDSRVVAVQEGDRKSTRLNSSHSQISDAVFCLKKTKKPPASCPPAPSPTVPAREPLLGEAPFPRSPDRPAPPLLFYPPAPSPPAHSRCVPVTEL